MNQLKNEYNYIQTVVWINECTVDVLNVNTMSLFRAGKSQQTFERQQARPDRPILRHPLAQLAYGPSAILSQ